MLCLPRVTCLAGIACISFFAVNAQQSDTSAVILSEVVVTATLTPEPIMDVPKSLSVVRPQQVQLLQPMDCAQMLSFLPGISVAGSNLNPGMTESVFLRGTNANHTALFSDGVRITDPSTVNMAIDWAEWPLSGFSQVEILRGPQSTLLGSGGIGGVISFLTPGWQQKGLTAQARLSTGWFGPSTSLFQQQVQAGYSFANGMYVRLDIFNKMVQGLDATVDTVTDPQAFKRYDNDDLRLTKGLLKIGLEKNNWDIFITGSLTDQLTDFDKRQWKYNNPFGENPKAWYDGDRADIAFNRQLGGYQLQRRFANDRFTLRLSGGLSNLERHVTEDSSVVKEDGTTDHTYFASTYVGHSMNHDAVAIASWNHVKLIGGIGMLRQTMSTQQTYFSNTFWGPYTFEVNLDSLDLSSQLWHAFAQAEVAGPMIHQKLEPLSVSGAIRLSSDKAFGTHWDMEVASSWKLSPQALAYVRYASGFQPPSLYQLYAPDKYYLSDLTRGNPNLRPETSTSWEVGSRAFEKYIAVDIALFRMHVHDVIEYCYLWDGSIPLDSLGSNWMRDDFRGDTYLNAGTLESQGVELSVTAKPNRWLDLTVNATLLDAALQVDSTTLHGDRFKNYHVQLFSSGLFPKVESGSLKVPRRSSTVQLILRTRPFKHWEIFAIGRWVNKRFDVFYDGSIPPYGALNSVPVDAYLLTDVGFQWNVLRQLQVSGKVENVFNTAYTDLLGYTSRPRGYYASVTFTY